MSALYTRAALAALLSTQAGLLIWAGLCHSPTYDETPHVAAGLSKWRFGQFDLYRVNPPLAEMVATAPLLAIEHAEDWSNFSAEPDERPEFAVGRAFAAANGRRTLQLIMTSRCALIPLVLAGGLVCYLYARDLFGRRSGIIAAALWCFSPTVLGLGSVVTSDTAAASLGLAAGYLFWRWLRDPGWLGALAAGVGLGWALLTKFSLLAFVPLWPALWSYYRMRRFGGDGCQSRILQCIQMIAIILSALFIVDCGYGFEEVGRPLGDFRFVSELMAGKKSASVATGNRFAGGCLSRMPVPVPANYIVGIDVQKRDFETAAPVYLAGTRRLGGFWYYYIYAMFVKEPIGLWALLACATPRSWEGRRGDIMAVLAPLVAVLLLVSWNHALCHYRYVLPGLGYLFVYASGAFRQSVRLVPSLRAVACISTLWYSLSSLAVAPHWGSYFQEIAGSSGGPRHLSVSALDWGQGLVELRQWLDRHPEASPLYLAYAGNFDPNLLGIEFQLPPEKLTPGWYVISASLLAGWDRVVAPHGRPVAIRSGRFDEFGDLVPVYRAADVLYVYHVTPEEAERLRREDE